MTCNCADAVDRHLADHNARLTRAIVFSDRPSGANPNLMLYTEQIERGRGKKKASPMFLTYCPFCGVKYDPTESAS